MTGHVVRASTPETIESDLLALWREVARDAPTTVRAVMSNLVVFRALNEADVDVTAPLDDAGIIDVASHHPSRVIVLVHARSDFECGTPIAAAAGILTFGSGEARHAVEQIAVRSRCTDEALPSIVRRLIRGDVPTSVWWSEDLSQSAPLTALMTMGRQLLYDSRRWVDVRAGVSTVARLLDHPHAPCLADLSWRRLAPMREALRHGLRAGDLVNAPSLRASVLHAQGQEALAWLLVGWMSSCLARPSERELSAIVTEQHGGDEVMSVSIDRGQATAEITATMSGRQVMVTLASGAPSFFVTVPQASEADTLAAELQALNQESGLIESVRAANVRLTAAA